GDPAGLGLDPGAPFVAVPGAVPARFGIGLVGEDAHFAGAVAVVAVDADALASAEGEDGEDRRAAAELTEIGAARTERLGSGAFSHCRPAHCPRRARSRCRTPGTPRPRTTRATRGRRWSS